MTREQIIAALTKALKWARWGARLTPWRGDDLAVEVLQTILDDELLLENVWRSIRAKVIREKVATGKDVPPPSMPAMA